MNDFVLRGIFSKARPLLGLTLIGLVLFSGCITSESSKLERKEYCEGLNGQYYYREGLGRSDHYCSIKTKEIWDTYYIIKINGVLGLEK